MATTWAAACSLGRAGKETVAGWPTATRATSVSLKPALTCRASRSIRVIKPWLLEVELDPPELAPPPDAPVPEPEEAEEADDPPPAAVCPTWPLTTAMVPAGGVVSLGPASA